jgi:outer membrane lipoprotein-sorting protein
MKKYLLSLALILFALARPALAASEKDELALKLAKTIDERMRSSGDYKALIFMEQKAKGKNDLVYQLVTYRRDEDEKLMILFLQPKSEAGKGYLRLDKNLFMYDPTVGKWERRTERERIGGTGSNRKDFDQSKLAEEYVVHYVAEEKLGKFKVDHIKLDAKKEADVAYPIMEMWIDSETGNNLKTQERAISGKLMRSIYYPKWEKMFSKSKNADIYFPKEIRIYDEVEKENSTLLFFRKVDLDPLEANIFTKAWLESKSR